MWLNGEDVTRQIRDPQVDDLVSIISAIPLVRAKLVAMQRKIGEEGGLVCEGRDIGTVVFPDAQVKIFMQADLEVRALRRVKELAEKSIDSETDQVVENLRFRDEYDSKRQHSPLKKAEEAVVVDTTDMTIEQEIELVKKIVQDRLAENQ